MSSISRPVANALRTFLANRGEYPNYLATMQKALKVCKDDTFACLAAASCYETEPDFPLEVADLIKDEHRVLGADCRNAKASCERAADIIAENEEKVQVRAKKHKNWESLIEAIDRSKKAPELEWFRWAIENVDIPPEKIAIDEVPCVGAASFLKRLQSDARLYNDIMLRVWPQLMPDKRTMEYEARFQQGGKRSIEELEKWQRDWEAENAGRDEDTGTGSDSIGADG